MQKYNEIDWNKVSKNIAQKKKEMDEAKVEIKEDQPKPVIKISLEDAIKIIAM